MNQQPDPNVMDRVNQALFAGRLIEAIKTYRSATGCGLKEAKDFVEALDGRLRAEVPERFTAAPRITVQVSPAGCTVLLAALLAAGVGVGLIWLLMN
jgi:ribosomal protein L7/L12